MTNLKPGRQCYCEFCQGKSVSTDTRYNHNPGEKIVSPAPTRKYRYNLQITRNTLTPSDKEDERTYDICVSNE